MNEERIIYIVNGSIPSWRVLIALEEKGLSFVRKRLYVMRAERDTKTPEFLALNPRGQAPLLVEPDNTKINESLAILHYLELRYPETPLLPSQKDRQEYANAIAWVQEAETFACSYEPLEQLFLKKPQEFSEPDRKEIKNALTAIEFDLDLWETRAKQHTFIASDMFTLADCSFYPVLAYLMRRGLTLDKFPALQAYKLLVGQRSSAKASRPEGWLYDRPSKINLFELAKIL